MDSRDQKQAHSKGKETGSSSLEPGDDLPAIPAGFRRRREGIDFKRLRELVTIEDVLALLQWQPVSRRGAQLRGPCPIHRSSSPQSRSLSVSIAKNAFQCFGCGKKGNQLDLFAAALNLPLYDAAMELERRLNLHAPSQSG